MALITKSYTFTTGATIVASEHNSNADTIYNDYNGNIDNTNIKASAAIAGSKLDLTSPGTIGSTTPAPGKFTTLQATGVFKLQHNASIGTAILSAGTTTINTLAVAGSSCVFLSTVSTAGTTGYHYATITSSGAYFTIYSTAASDYATVNWALIDHS